VVDPVPLTVLLFDLGGVLVENVGIVENLNKLLGKQVDEQTMKERWLRSPAARDFELGRVSPGVFAARFLHEWGSDVSPHAFLADVASWLGRPYPGAAELLRSLRPRHHVSCLSNCNELHWAKLTDFLRNFDSVFSSHLLGEIKPDPGIFETVMETLGVGPAQVRFFDDLRSNTQAAEALGIQAFVVHGLEEVHACLEQQALL
jgi:glucose-1-phosphatase